ncbi:MAG: hypothetical protein ABJA84_00715, partial [Polaromonas sp.]
QHRFQAVEIKRLLMQLPWLLSDVTQTVVFLCCKWENYIYFWQKPEHINLCFALFSRFVWDRRLALRKVR